MDNNLKQLQWTKMLQTQKKLREHRFKADVFETKEECLDYIRNYLSSSNAVTMDGQLYNVDGNGNRVAALTYGPEHVLVICGVNKIVKNLEEAELRVRNVAAPANCVRLHKDSNPCTKTGTCMDCRLPSRICSVGSVLFRSHVEGRIHVLLVNEELGY